MVFYGGGAYEAELAGTQVRLIRLNKRGRWDILPFLCRLVAALRKERPRAVHSYLGVPNILTAVLKPFLPGTHVVWGVRASNVNLSRYDWLARLAYRLECRLSRFADLIIANSQAGRSYAITHGFPAQHTVVIWNGIDTERFRVDSHGRAHLRAEWGIHESELLVGLVARKDPMKDHVTFLQAMSLLAARYGRLRFVCVGDGTPTYSASLKQLAASLGLEDRLVWSEARDDMPAVYSALDVATSCSSFGEGFSNTIAEAMACGVPCVVTDVGDSLLIVGELSRGVAPGDKHALAAAISRLIDMPEDQRRKLGEACRARVISEFGIERMVRRTEKVLRRI